MPANIMTLFPHLLSFLEAGKLPIQTAAAMTTAGNRTFDLGMDLVKAWQRYTFRAWNRAVPLCAPGSADAVVRALSACEKGSRRMLDVVSDTVSGGLVCFQRERMGELDFLRLFTDDPPPQDWDTALDDSRLLLDLPGIRLIDISGTLDHRIGNYTVVFAPRAGHHSNIAERVATFLRDRGLTRMAVVEQKCAEEIPLEVDGRRHEEGFDGQVAQYRRVLAHLKRLTGHPPHLVAICQPGPLLISTLIRYPDLGKTFGTAGSPMHTEAEKGFLTDLARMAGPAFLDRMMTCFPLAIDGNRRGKGRKGYDGRLQVLGFYMLGMEHHMRNLKRLLADLNDGNQEQADRQKAFYHWYNTVYHFPAGFIRDTYRKIFVGNDLIHGRLTIAGRTLGIGDYPGSVPIWALGGSRDDIAPPGQATGHLPLIDSVKEQDKLSLVCDGGHMALFRSAKVLQAYYTKIAGFMLAHSDGK